MLGWRIEYFTQWPYVKNLVAHHSLYNWGPPVPPSFLAPDDLGELMAAAHS